jgi:hypothetical protein
MSLAELEVQSRKESFAAFVAGAWEGAEPSQLLSLAKGAGLSGGDADAFVSKVAQARELVARTQRLPRLRKDAAGLQAQYDKLSGRAAAEISRLEAEVQDAALEADDARRAVYEAEDCARQLLTLYDAGELPGTEAPEEVIALVERRDAEEHAHQMTAARIAAENHRNDIRLMVRNLEHQLQNLPIAITSEMDGRLLENQLQDARQQLADAESALRKAEAAEDPTRSAIP